MVRNCCGVQQILHRRRYDIRTLAPLWFDDQALLHGPGIGRYFHDTNHSDTGLFHLRITVSGDTGAEGHDRFIFEARCRTLECTNNQKGIPMFGMTNRKNSTTRTIEPSLRATFTESEIASMAGLGTLINIDARHDLMIEGTNGDFVYFICSGSAAVSRNDEMIAMLSPGDMVGERAFLTGEPRNSTVTAMEPLTALQFDQQQFAWLRLESVKVRELSETLVASRS